MTRHIRRYTGNSPITNELRDATVKAVERLLQEGAAINYKGAFKIVWFKAREKGISTGFKGEDWIADYLQFLKYKNGNKQKSK